MSNFENPTWRTAAILKIIIFPYLSHSRPNFTKFSMHTQILSHIENHFLAITRLRRVRLRRNVEFGGIIARTRRLSDEMSNSENPTWRTAAILKIIIIISISQPQIVRISQNLVCRHKFYRI